MAETRDYTKLVPMTPPEGLMDWAMRNCKELQQDRMIYKMIWQRDPITGLRHKAVRGFCTACGKSFVFGYYGGVSTASAAPFGFWYDDHEGQGSAGVWTGKEILCPEPECGKELTVTHCGDFRDSFHLGQAWVMTVGAIETPKVGGAHCAPLRQRERMPVLTGWYVGREVRKQGERYRVETILRPHEAYVVEARKLVRLKAYFQYIYAVTYLDHWEQMKRGTDEWGSAPYVFPWDRKLLEGSGAENSALDKYLQVGGDRRPVSYMGIWTKHKNVENLVVQGLGGLLNNIMETNSWADGYYGKRRVGKLLDINWKEVKPHRMLGITREELRWVKALHMSTQGLRMLRALRVAGQAPKNLQEAKELNDFGPEGVKYMAEDGAPALKAVRYLTKQKRKYKADKRLLGYSYLRDYWDMAQKAGDDLKDPTVRFPQRLTTSHDGVLLRTKFDERPELREGFRAVSRRLEPLAWEQNGILILPCPNQSELIKEGKVLSHCVAKYAKTHVGGEDCIFFIRRAEAPEMPFYTLELDVKHREVLQNLGKRNCARTKEVKAFEEAWLKHIKTIRLEGEPPLPGQTERKVS